MYMSFKVTYSDDRTIECHAKPKDVVAFERQYGVPFASFAEGSAPMEWIYYLAWSPLHRAKKEPRAFDEFLDDVDDVEPLRGPAPDPTQPDLSDGSLPDSPAAPA